MTEEQIRNEPSPPWIMLKSESGREQCDSCTSPEACDRAGICLDDVLDELEEID